MAVFCPQCGTQAPDGARFCGGCGATMPAPPPPPARTFCPQCGTELPPGAAFCANCGTPLGGAAAGGVARSAAFAAMAPPAALPLGAGALAVPPVPGLAAAGTSAPAYAGFWRRVGAALVDGILLSIVSGVIFAGPLAPIAAGLAGSVEDIVEDPETFLVSYMLQLLTVMSALSLLYLALVYVYFVVATGLWGRTVGKRLLGLRVVNAVGQPPGIGRALLREIVGKFLSGLLLGLGYLWVAWDERKQGWHDKIAGTTVVRG